MPSMQEAAATVTVAVSVTELWSMVARITVLPAAFPVTCPELFTLAIVGSELSHRICRFTSTIFSVGVPTIWALSPTSIIRLVGARRSVNSTGKGTLLSGAGTSGPASALRRPASTPSVPLPATELAQPVNKERAANRVIFNFCTGSWEEIGSGTEGMANSPLDILYHILPFLGH